MTIERERSWTTYASHVASLICHGALWALKENTTLVAAEAFAVIAVVISGLANLISVYSNERDGRSKFCSCKYKMAFSPFVYAPELGSFVWNIVVVSRFIACGDDLCADELDAFYNSALIVLYSVPVLSDMLVCCFPADSSSDC